jgi:hypothetical protein
MSDSADIVLTFSVINCQAEQFMSYSAEILIFTQRNSLQRIIQISGAFRQVCSPEQGLFSLGLSYYVYNEWSQYLKEEETFQN